MHSRFFKAAMAAFALVLSFPLSKPVLAQSAGSGAIAGTITDPAGAVIPGIPVVITDSDTGATRTVTSNGAGYFSAPFLQPGHYEVVLGGGSFSKVDRKSIIVAVGDTLALDTRLTPATVSTEVEVTTEAPVLDTAKTDVDQTIDRAFVNNLPVNGRRYDNFVLLTTNVVPDGSSGILSFRGISGLYNENLVDGTNNNQAFFSEARGRASGAPYVYSEDSIQEFAASASGYSAEFGEAAGGIINAITRSGSNVMHGDLFYYLRYPDLNALDPYSKWSALHNGGNPALLTQTVHQQQQFGGSVGGAIIKDKLFYFFTYDGYRKVNPILYTSSVSAATLAQYATNTYTVGGVTQTTCPAPLTTAQCQAATTYILSTLGTFQRNLKQDIFFPKLDYQINQKNHISAQFLWDDFHQPNGYNSSATVNNGSVTNNGTANFHERILIANLESQLTANSANELHTQWSRDLETDTTNAPGPYFSLASLVSYGETSALPRPKFPDEHRWEAFDVYTFNKGKHTPKIGVDLNFIHEQLQNLFQGDGSYTYGGTAQVAFCNWVQDVYDVSVPATTAGSAPCGTTNAGTGKHYTSFTQVTDAINKTAPGLDDFWNKNLAVFAEDNWKVTPKLLVNAGIRYDVQLVPQPPHPYTTSYNGVASPLGNYYTNTIHINYKMYQPRVGFAWNAQPGTVLRGGYGLFYGLNSNSLYYTTRVENGVYQQQYNVTSPINSNAIQAPNVLFTPPGPALAAPFSGAATPQVVTGGGLSALSFRGIDPKFTNPYTHSFDLTLEQQLPLHTTLTLSYVGTRGMRLPYDIDVNQPAPTTIRTYTILNAAGAVDPTKGANGTVTVPFTPAGTARPSPNDGNVLVGFSGVNTWYHSGAFSIKRPFDHGFELLLNETWSHALDLSEVSGGNSVQNSGGGTFQGTNIILDPFNIRGKYSNGVNMTGEYGRSDLDIRTRFVGTLLYTSTFHTSFSRGVNYAINGWEVSGTYTAQSGQPLTELMNNTLPSGTYAGLDGGATGEAVTLNDSNGAGRVPFVSRNNKVFAGIHNIDARAGRVFPLHNQMNVSFYAEAFNLLNHRQVLGVSSSAYQYIVPGGKDTASGIACPASATAPCIAPLTSADTATPFGVPTTTSGVLYGARQLQFVAKFNF
jgi:hypothetical protein